MAFFGNLLVVLLILVGSASGLAVLDAYRGLLATHPLKTNMATASILSITSDAIAQSMERRKLRQQGPGLVLQPKAQAHAVQPKAQVHAVPRHDYQRSLAMGFYGATVFGAFVCEWFKLLSWMCPTTPGDWGSILRKVGVNQLFMSPFLNALFFSWVTFTRNPLSPLSTKLTTLKSKLAQDLLPTILRSCVFWTIWNLGNFSKVGAKWQVVVTNVGFLSWTVYLSLVGYREVPAKKQS